MNIEYYSIGSESEAHGLTVMSRTVDENGKPIVQYGGGPDAWYKPVKITKERYDEIKALLRDPRNRGFFGLVNSTGRAAANAMFEKVGAKRRADKDAIIAHEAKKVDAMVEAGIFDEESVEQELKSRGFKKEDREKIKDKRNKKPA